MPERKAKIKWEDPPPPKHQYPWSEIAAALRSKPMTWGLVFDKDRVSIVNALRQGSIAAVHPDLGFEIRTTNNDRSGRVRTCTLYLRWNPDKESSPLRGTITSTRKKGK